VAARKLLEPYLQVCQSSIFRIPGLHQRTLTSIIVLPDLRLDRAPVGLVEALSSQGTAGRAEAAGVHGALQSIVLPAEDVVAVLGVASPGDGSVSSHHENT
jgi:hypothetical protein